MRPHVIASGRKAHSCWPALGPALCGLQCHGSVMTVLYTLRARHGLTWYCGMFVCRSPKRSADLFSRSKPLSLFAALRDPGRDSTLWVTGPLSRPCSQLAAAYLVDKGHFRPRYTPPCRCWTRTYGASGRLQALKSPVGLPCPREPPTFSHDNLVWLQGPLTTPLHPTPEMRRRPVQA